MSDLVQVWTDGSIAWNPGGPMGWGFVAIDRWGDITERCGGAAEAPENTNNKAELLAVMHALEWLQGMPATIRTDSQYARNGMNDWWKGWVRKGWRRMEHGVQVPIPNADLWQPMLKLRAQGQIIEWVRGHNKDFYNERADALALQGRLANTPKEIA